MEPKNKKINSSANPTENHWLSLIPTIIAALTLFLVPIFLDIKLVRPKLLVLEIGVFVFFFFYLFTAVLKSPLQVKKSPLNLPLLVYGIFSGLYYYLTPDRPLALSELQRIVLCLTIFYGLSNILKNNLQRRLVLNGWLAGGFLAIIYGLLQHSGGIYLLEVPRMGRIMSTFGNPIFFGAYLVITLPILLGFYLYYQTEHPARKSGYKLYLLLVFGLGLIALFYTQTRAAWLGFTGAILFFVAATVYEYYQSIKDVQRRKKWRYNFLLLVVSGFILIAIFGYWTRAVWQRQQGHLLIWRDSLKMWLDHPWLGTGPGTFHIYFPSYASAELLAIWPQQQQIVNDAHNEFLQILVETGLVGFGLYLFWLVVFFSGLKKFSVSHSEKYLLRGLTAAVIGLLIQNFFSVDMRFIISAAYLFIAVAIIHSFNSQYHQEQIPDFGKILLATGVILLAIIVGRQMLKPFIAQQKESQSVDFFQQQILEPAKTIAELEKLSQQYPDNPLVWEKLGWTYAKEIKNPRDNRINLTMAEKAIAAYQTAIRLQPTNAGPYNNIGNIYFTIGQTSPAINYWQKAIEINPRLIDARLNLATLYYLKGQLRPASEQLKTVLQLDPNNERAIVLYKKMVE